MKKLFALLILTSLLAAVTFGGIDVVRSNGISLTGADGVRFIGTSGITLTGADSFLSYQTNGITLTGADGITLTGADGLRPVGADGATYTGPNGITLTGADGITLTGADGITLTGADGITLTGADGTRYTADSIVVRRPDGITLTGADGITLTGADGITLTGADGVKNAAPNGITLTGADNIASTHVDGITLTGADGSTLTGADSITGFNTAGAIFKFTDPSGITLTGADGITLTGADNVNLTGADGIVMSNIDGITLTGADSDTGIQSVDPELALALNNATDDSTINAIVSFYDRVSDTDIDGLRQIGITGGTRFRVLPLVYVSGTRSQIIAISQLRRVRSIYGNRTLNFNSDPYFNTTGVGRVPVDRDLNLRNNGRPVNGSNITVAVLDTGINGLHPDLTGAVVQNVRLADTQSSPSGFQYPVPVEGLANTDPIAGHGTFVAGVIAATGASSGGKYAGVAPGAKLLGLSAGDVNLTSVLSGFDYLLEKGAAYNVRVVNCSFSANTVFDYNDPVNIATKMVTDRHINVVFSSGNSGPGNGTLNPYSTAPWVIGVAATDEKSQLAPFSSRGTFGGYGQQPTLAAPGVNIVSLRNAVSSTGLTGLAGADSQRLSAGELPYYTSASGTSFSAPQVAGAIALMLEVNSNLRPSDVKEILSRTSTPLPRYFFHEGGSGMLNTHAAVLDAAFPNRRIGGFRSILTKNPVRFTTSTAQRFTQLITPGVSNSLSIRIADNVVLANVGISWGLSTNDFGLKLFNANNELVDESNYLNLPGLTGRYEGVSARNPAASTYRIGIQHSGFAGRSQNVYGLIELTSVEYPVLVDLRIASPIVVSEAEKSMLANLMLPEGKMFRPNSAVSRADLAAAFVRSGLVSQYVAGNPLFSDVNDMFTRNSVESVQANPNGKLFYDAAPGQRFYPDNSSTKLLAAIAFVKAANLDSFTSTSSLPLSVVDTMSIPAQFRGYVALALQKGFITLDGNNFNPNRPLTRFELARALNLLAGK